MTSTEAQRLQACVQEITAILYNNTDVYLEEDAKESKVAIGI